MRPNSDELGECVSSRLSIFFLSPPNQFAWIIGAWYYSPNSFILSYPVLTVVEFTPTAFHAPIGHVEDHTGHWIAFHNRIKLTTIFVGA